METIAVLLWVMLGIASRWIENDSRRAIVRIALCAIGLCWLIVRSGLISI